MPDLREPALTLMPQPDIGHDENPPAPPFGEVPPDGSTPVSLVDGIGSTRVDSLISGLKWGGVAGTGTTLEYSFPADGASWVSGYGEPSSGFRPLTDAQQAAARTALQSWAEVASIDFTEMADTSTNVGTIRFGMSSLPETAWAYYPSTAASGGDVWLGTGYHGGGPSYAEGTYFYQTIVHEIGHALGLKHPHEGGGTGVVLPAAEDWLGTSVMSYRSYVGDSTSGGGYSNEFYPSRPMLYDILAIQYLYGANYSTRADDTVYSWSPGERIFETLWDGGGTDLIDWSNQSTAAVIRLEAGSWSELGQPYTYLDPSLGSVPTTLAIAYDVVIENARGGSASDQIFGNAVANGLFGLAGGDTLRGAGGNDLIEPGTGNDIVYGGQGFDKVSYFNDVGSLGVTIDLRTDLATRGGEIDRVYEIEAADGTRNNDLIVGDVGANALGGADGVDTLRGLGGNDTLRGGVGNDLLEPGFGNDQVYGGPGLDKVSYFNDGAARGVRVDLAAGTATRGSEADRLYDVENIDGTNGNDALYGNALVNNLGGADGNDLLFGRAGNDILRGAGGIDRIAGEQGRDALTGGGLNDVFDLNAVLDSPWSVGKTTCDVITDFTHLGDDLDLSTIDARTTTGANEAFTFLAAKGAAFTGIGQVRWYQSGGNTFVEASNDADRAAELQIQLTGLKVLTIADFVL